MRAIHMFTYHTRLLRKVDKYDEAKGKPCQEDQIIGSLKDVREQNKTQTTWIVWLLAALPLISTFELGHGNCYILKLIFFSFKINLKSCPEIVWHSTFIKFPLAVSIAIVTFVWKISDPVGEMGKRLTWSFTTSTQSWWNLPRSTNARPRRTWNTHSRKLKWNWVSQDY